jgi:hypothetical protein
MGLPHPARLTPPGRTPPAASRLAILFALGLAFAVPARAALVINEIFPNPVGSETGPQEKVEIYNTGPNAVDMTGWAIDDAATIGQVAVRSGIPENLDAACSTNPVIQPGEYRVCYIAGSAALNNTGDTVYLVSDRLVNATVVHTVTYPATVGEGQSWACVPNGTSSFAWTSTITLCSSNGGATGDVTAPATVSLTAAPGAFAGEVRLTWTAPGDDGNTGTASAYIIKVSHAAINAGNFDAAADLDRWIAEPLPHVAATPETLFVFGLATDSTWHFALKSTDEVPNTSAISNDASTSPFAGTMLSPNLGYQHYYGNLHSHTGYSDGTGTPAQAFDFARNTAPTPLDFLAVTEHNHVSAGMSLANYPLLKNEAAAANDDGNFVAIFGQEWGIISTGGHANVFESPTLFGWDSGNYDVFVAQTDYTGLYSAFVANPPAGGLPKVVEWCHPSTGDFNNYAVTADGKAVVSQMAIGTGPAFSTSTTESDAPSTTGNEVLFQDALRKGFRVSPTVDQDNHNATWGAATQGRTVALAAGKTKSQILGALAARRSYASMDHNTQLLLSVEGHAMGEAWTVAQGPRFVVQVLDPDVGETVAQIDLLRGITGVSNAVLVATGLGNSSFAWRELQSFPTGTEAHYYVRVRMSDNSMLWSGPVYVTYDPSAVTAVGDRPGGMLQLAVGPNPMYTRVSAAFSLSSDVTDGDLSIYDASGRRVASILNGPLSAGDHRVEWTGLDDSGHRVAAGLFFMRLRAGGHTAVHKVMLVR